MSRSVDLFIGSDLSIDELAKALGALTKSTVEFVPERSSYFLSGSGSSAELHEHGFVDDGDLWLSRYRYVLSARVNSEFSTRDSAEAAFLRSVNQRLREATPWPALLVLDLQFRDSDLAAAFTADPPLDAARADRPEPGGPSGLPPAPSGAGGPATGDTAP